MGLLGLFLRIRQLLNLHGLGLFCEATIPNKIYDLFMF